MRVPTCALTRVATLSPTTPRSCTVSLECIHLCPPAKEWSIERHLIISPGLIGTGDREFPSMAFTATATRVPYFHILNLAVPMGLFSLLSVAQCYVTDATDVNHRAQLSLMLVLTASAYKMAIANKLPAIAYMTMLDSYTLWNFLVIIVIALESRSVGRGSQHMVPVGGQIDTAFTFCISVGWLIMHAYFGAKVQHYIRNPEAMDDRVIEQVRDLPRSPPFFSRPFVWRGRLCVVGVGEYMHSTHSLTMYSAPH